MRLTRLGLAAAALLTMACPAGSAWAQVTPSGPVGGSTTITNSPGATTSTTWNDNRTIIYQQAKADPVTQQFVATLRNYNQYFAQPAQFWLAMRVRFVALAPGAAKEAAGKGIVYLVVAARMDIDEYEDFSPCAVEPGVGVFGLVGNIPAKPEVAGFSIRRMGPENAEMMRAICAGLRAPLHAGLGQPSAYKSLAGDNGYVALLMFSDDFAGTSLESTVFEDYWMRALASRYTGLPPIDAAAAMAIEERVEEFEDGGSLDIPFPLPLTPAGPITESRRSREEFGGRVDRLITDWRTYLSGAAITLRGNRRPLIVDGKYARLIPRFEVSEIGSRPFWLAADDLGALVSQSECLKQHFLYDRGYVSPDSFQVPGTCALDAFRLPG